MGISKELQKHSDKILFNLADLILIYNFVKEKIDFVSDSCAELTGYTVEDFDNEPSLLEKLVHPEDYPIHEYIFTFHDFGRRNFILRWIHKNGTILWTEQVYVDIYDEETGELEKTIIFIKDISKEKNIEFALRNSEKKFRELFDHANDLILLCSVDEKSALLGSLAEINKFALDKLGYSKEEISNLDPYELFTLETANKINNFLNDDKTGNSRESQFEAVLLDKYKKQINTDFNCNMLYLEGVSYMFAIARDITVKKKVEEQISRIENLQSIGIMAGGIAHDFNNLLTALLGNITLARINSGNEVDNQNFLSEAERITYKAKDLTQQLLTFSREGKLSKEVKQITELLKETVVFALRGSNVTSEFRFKNDIKPVEVDETQMTRVIQNLIINAKQAMPDGGKIKITCQNVFIEENVIPSLHKGDYIQISIEDQGIGIPESDKNKIFVPFFTTKKKGNGLGLASCFSIISQHNGIITLESELGVGTVFHIYLPVSTKEIAPRKVKRGEVVERKGARVLCMDDEQDILTILGKMLSKLGHTSESVTTGEEALELYKKRNSEKTPFDIVIMDLVIAGGMGGKKTIKKLLEYDKDARAIVSSAHLTDEAMENPGRFGFKAALPKPYTFETLEKVIHTILEE